MFKSLFFISILFFSTSLRAETKLVVFSLHGFLSDETAFCEWKDILQETYGDQILFVDLVYPTLDAKDKEEERKKKKDRLEISNQNIEDFTKEVFRQMMSTYIRRQLDIDTPFMFLNHSQGGLVGLRYVADCIYANKDYCRIKWGESYLRLTNLKYFVSIASPYWGSTAANQIKFFNFARTRLPFRQLQDLSQGSAIITYNREASLLPILESGKSIFPEQTTVISISADISKSRLGFLFNLATHSSKNRRLEHDLVVPMFSSNLDYFYKIYPQDRRLSPIEGKAEMSDYYYPIDGFHAQYGFMEGVACLQKESKSGLSFKEQTTYLIIRNHLDKFLEANIKNKVDLFNEDRFIDDLQTFNIEVKFNLPQKEKWFQKIHFLNRHIQPFSEDDLVLRLTRRNGLFHTFRGFNYDHTNSNLNYVTYFHTGFFEPNGFLPSFDFSTRRSSHKIADYGLEINLPWFQPAKIEVSVSPSYTTFVEYNLEPINYEILAVEKDGYFFRNFNDKKIAAVRKSLFSTRILHLLGERGVISELKINNRDWLSLKETSDYQLLNDRVNECYIATVSKDYLEKDFLYLGFYDKKPQEFLSLRTKENLKLNRFFVYGRYAEGDFDSKNEVYEKDRVLVSNRDLVLFDRRPRINSPLTDQYLRSGHYWVDTKNIRLLEPCDLQDFQSKALDYSF